jgi:hypothetical protein
MDHRTGRRTRSEGFPYCVHGANRFGSRILNVFA